MTLCKRLNRGDTCVSPGATSSFVLASLFLIVGCQFSKTEPTTTSSNKNNHAIERASEKGPVKLVVKVNPDEPRLSDMVELEVLITFPVGIEVKSPVFGQAVGDFVIRDYTERSDSNPSKGEKESSDTKTRRFLYKLEPPSSGRHLVRSVGIEFVDNRPLSEQKGVKTVIESEPIEINVTSELGDGIPSLTDLEPMVPPRALEQSRSMIWIVVTSIAVAIIVGVFWLRRRKMETSEQAIQRTPEEIAHAAFDALMAENLPSKGLLKEFYLKLTGIVRHFIEGKTGLRAPEQTTEEFLRAMRSRDVFTAERSIRLQEFLEAADMVKYAGQQPDQHQIELSISRAREFVDYRPSGLMTAATMSATEEA